MKHLREIPTVSLPVGALNMGYKKFRGFRPISPNILQKIQDSAIVTIEIAPEVLIGTSFNDFE